MLLSLCSLSQANFIMKTNLRFSVVFMCFMLLVSTTIQISALSTLDPHIDFNETSRFMKVAPTRNRSGMPNSIYPDKGSGVFSNTFLRPVDCEELLQLGYITSGVYNIWPRNKLLDGKSLQVYCDMDTDKGGWTVLQRRGNFLRPADYFYRDWASYKDGFGDIERDFWLGNDNIFALTNQRVYSVRFDLTDIDGDHRYALYDIFYIDDEENKYKLTIQDYSGNANDSMIEGKDADRRHNGQRFTTKDRDNDNHKYNCAVKFKGAWWYNQCHSANLNGLYLRGKTVEYGTGVNWVKWKGDFESLEKTEIKIRPKNFRKTLI